MFLAVQPHWILGDIILLLNACKILFLFLFWGLVIQVRQAGEEKQKSKSKVLTRVRVKFWQILPQVGICSNAW